MQTPSMMDAGLYHYSLDRAAGPPATSADMTTAQPDDRRPSAWERRGGNPPFRMQVVRRRRCDKRRRRYQHSEKIEVLTWLEEFRVPRRPFDSRFLREEDDIDDPDFRRPTVIEAAKYFDIPRESIMNWRKQRARLLPSAPPTVLTPPDTPCLPVSSLLNQETTPSSLAPDSYERTRRILSITSLIEPPSPASTFGVSPSPEPSSWRDAHSEEPRLPSPGAPSRIAWSPYST